jgi:hypothetical protein
LGAHATFSRGFYERKPKKRNLGNENWKGKNEDNLYHEATEFGDFGTFFGVFSAHHLRLASADFGRRQNAREERQRCQPPSARGARGSLRVPQGTTAWLRKREM